MQCDLKKLLACCEHHDTVDDIGKFNEVIQYFPSQSGVRIVEYLRRTLSGTRNDRYYQRGFPQDFIDIDSKQ